MTTVEDGLFQYGGAPVGGMFTNGKSYFVKPYSGHDANSGKTLKRPWSTLAHARAKATAQNNDVVYFISENSSLTYTTDFQSTTLLWDNDLTHLIGVNSGNAVAQRSRIESLSTATGANLAPLMTVSAASCYIANIHIINSHASTTAKGALLVSGDRNHIVNCHIAGMADTTRTADVAGNYSLKVTGSENLFEDCTIGLDTVGRDLSGTGATYEMYMSGGATRNIFRRCRIITYATNAGFTFLTVPVNGIDRWNLFEDCQFINMPTGVASGTTITQGFSVTGGGSPDGCILLRNCEFIGMGASESAASGKVYYNGYASRKMIATALA
jgi:hypothetical protein